MPLRNLSVVFLAMLISVACYRTASRNRFVGTLAEAMNLVVENYVDEVDDRKLFEGAMEGMIDELDPYSKYTTPDELPKFQESIGQEFPGIGIVVELDEKEKRLKVRSPIPKLPAFMAGLKAGDIILKIDGQDTADKSLEDCTKMIRGEEGTLVKLEIKRASEEKPLTFEVQRAKIPIESVKGDRHDAAGEWIFNLPGHERLGYVRIVSFGERTVDELKTALETFGPGAKKIDGLIIDLRGNAGGLLTAAVGVCDAFLDTGLIVSTRGRNKVELEAHNARSDLAIPKNLPVIVLVDGFSASASEIVAACLQDHDRAMVAGQRSWGKGTVQKVYMLEGNKSALRLTFATYWRPSGKDIHKRRDAKDTDDWGVRPDEGLEVLISKELQEKLYQQRAERDVSAVEGMEPADSKPGKSEPPKAETKKPDSEDSTPVPPIPEPEPEGDTTGKAPVEDPQLQRAIEFFAKLKAKGAA
ncbi:Carboxy-terminal processing protease CtpB precursor [Anatilimnocola aggregata]|uniref:Carboxy-terminal processing protease CtpB n=1 Tax=Anatilimnocola aggregata TaxID=2528021 RepID=A0A517YHL0_9BACT|nr:S41 family peptidase [Anatilimnocola aggregata]QDU29699.1 Carboxy-terminal processing protease CtpB precursor [Anatilimnocola aggregata]